MSTLEDRVRAAARAAAATVAEGSAPPLRLAQPGRRPGPRGWDGRHRWIVPLAAAAAVIAVVAASISTAGVLGTRRPAPVTRSVSLRRLVNGLPAYFLEYSPIPSRVRSRATLQVMATATGKVAATATLPGYVAAFAASSGAFFAAAVTGQLAKFYEIRLNDRRTATTVTELPIRPDNAPIAFMAVSPDGTKLAYSTGAVHSASGLVQNLVVASTTDGSQREWLTPPQDSNGQMDRMTWLSDGRTLAFVWVAKVDTPSPAPSLRLLDTEAPGSDLMAGKTVLASVYEARLFYNELTLSPDGQVVVGGARGTAASRAPAGSVIAFSTATGKVTVLYRVSHDRYPGNGCYGAPVWINNTGSEMLVTCYQSHPRTTTYWPSMVLINHGHATVLPWLAAAAQQPLVGVPAFP